MRKWIFDDGITVYEVGFDYDLHSFLVYHNERYLGTVYPDSIPEMNDCIKALDGGENPIADDWEDGCGNACTLDGLGNEKEAEL